MRDFLSELARNLGIVRRRDTEQNHPPATDGADYLAVDRNMSLADALQQRAQR
jgi:hypothetical protein